MSRTILVTGASRGIGKAIAIRAGQQGFTVVVHYNANQEGAEDTLAAIQESGGTGRLISFDISDQEACAAHISEDMDTHGVYYGVVCNAGICRDKPFPTLTVDDWKDVLHTNLDGFYNVLHPVVMPMVRAKKGGRIVALSSESGITGNRGQVNYSAAKAGIIGAAKSLALELAKRHITVNCVAPGLIETDMLEGLRLEEAIKLVPMRRLGQPEEVASLVNFLLSDEAAYITRQVFAINGGMS
jgi:3-oxoacyl-[acyl-carrier protein] reductase